MKSTRLLLVLAALAFLAAACSKSGRQDHGSESAAGHVHIAPHGGTLVELGEHAYNLELVRDAAAGKLTVFVLDGHAEHFVRLPSATLELVAMPGGQFTPLTLRAVANPATGETVGDTSQFEVQAGWLKSAGAFSGIVTVAIKGAVFKDVAFALGDGHDRDGASGHAHAPDEKKGKPKPHDSPRGGTLVEIGEHEFNVDLVLDRATGTLHGWILGAHARGVDDRVRIAMPSFEAQVTVDGRRLTLVFQAQADPATGEKPGSTSVFDARADWLKTATTFEGVFPRLVIGGETFAGTRFSFPTGRTSP